MIVLSYEEKMKLAFAIRVAQNFMGWGPRDHGFDALHQKLGPYLAVGQEVIFRSPYSFEQPNRHSDPGPPDHMLGCRAVIVSFDPMSGKNVAVRMIKTPGKTQNPSDGEQIVVSMSWIRPLIIGDMSLDELEEAYPPTVGHR